MKILAFGDLHLGAGSGYGRTPGDRLNDQAEVLTQIFLLACEHQVDVIVNAGDTFHGPLTTPEQLNVFATFVAACHKAGIPIVAITGNGSHDQAMRGNTAVDVFQHQPGITVSSTPQLIRVAGATIATLPWVHPGRLIAARDGGTDRDDINVEAAGLLVATARGLRAQITDSGPAILALHGSISGASLPAGLPVDELREPVLDWDALDGLGFDAIVAGHIHKGQILGLPFEAKGETCGFYTGSPMPLNFGEADVEHGVWILELSDEVFDGVEYQFIPIESRPFVTLDADVVPEEAGDVMTALHAQIGLGIGGVGEAVVRLRYRATQEQQRRIDIAAIRAALLAEGAHVVKVEPDIVREDRTRVDAVTEDLEPAAAFDLYVEANDIDPDLALRARVRLAEHLEQVTA